MNEGDLGTSGTGHPRIDPPVPSRLTDESLPEWITGCAVGRFARDASPCGSGIGVQRNQAAGTRGDCPLFDRFWASVTQRLSLSQEMGYPEPCNGKT